MVSQLRFSRHTKAFYATLSDQDKLVFTEAALDLAGVPSPDRGVNLGLGFPYRSDIRGIELGDFRLSFFVHNDETLWIAYGAWKPTSSEFSGTAQPAK